MNGFLNLHKPAGVTSRGVVNRIVRLVGRGPKVGHAGTLDPLATGVLVVAVGPATRLIDRVQAQAKTYRAEIRLGARSDTDDADGTIVETPDALAPDEPAIRAALASQVGTIAQVPPQYSALKREGQRAYDLARQGEAVDLAPRPVRIDRIELLSYAWPIVTIEVDCGAGTYIRSIARDLGDALGCGGLITVLTRTRIGRFAIESALDPETLTAESIAAHVLPVASAVADLPRVDLDADQTRLIAHGRSLDAQRLQPVPPPGDLALFAPDGTLLALAHHEPDTRSVRPVRVLVGS